MSALIAAAVSDFPVFNNARRLTNLSVAMVLRVGEPPSNINRRRCGILIVVACDAVVIVVRGSVLISRVRPVPAFAPRYRRSRSSTTVWTGRDFSPSNKFLASLG